MREMLSSDVASSQKIRVRVLFESEAFKNTPSPVTFGKMQVYLEQYDKYTSPFKKEVQALRLRRRALELFISRQKDSLLLTESFFEIPSSFIEFLNSLNEKNESIYSVYGKNEKSVFFWDQKTKTFSSKLLLIQKEQYVNYLDLMTDSRKDWLESNAVFSQSQSLYKESLRFVSQGHLSMEEFTELTHNALAMKLLNEKHETVHVYTEFPDKFIPFPRHMTSLFEKSTKMYLDNANMRFSERYLGQRIFRSDELFQTFHNEHITPDHGDSKWSG